MPLRHAGNQAALSYPDADKRLPTMQRPLNQHRQGVGIITLVLHTKMLLPSPRNIDYQGVWCLIQYGPNDGVVCRQLRSALASARRSARCHGFSGRRRRHR
ncbi:hypothetical protein KCP78_10885 [Salmonella enterica subsp. enterica]|nr:hypothetical protein KCP78_10885 [Salmonella enterica subsp. enterica]